MQRGWKKPASRADIIAGVLGIVGLLLATFLVSVYGYRLPFRIPAWGLAVIFAVTQILLLTRVFTRGVLTPGPKNQE